MLLQNKKAVAKSARRKIEDAEQFAKMKADKLNQSSQAGKMSASKRRNKASAFDDDSGDDATENSDTMLTRLTE